MNHEQNSLNKTRIDCVYFPCYDRSMPLAPIVLKKVRVHNLKGVDLTLEPGKLVVFTGVSGSGKSSLAFDTIYVEGQRRYIESLSHQARRSLAELPKPEAESITGIAPTIAIEQKQAGNTPRSTVGTMTGIYDFLRVLFARIGVPHCPVSGESVAAQSREKIAARLKSTPENTKFIILSPYARGKKAEFKEDFAELLSKGFMRLRVDGEWLELGTIDKLDGARAHDVDLVVDRLVHTKENEPRITEAINQALDLGSGHCSAYFPDSKEEIFFSEHAFCPKSGLSYGPLEPHDFSFNHPTGMCPICHGLGVSQEFDLDKIIDENKSIAENCCSIGSGYNTVRYGNIYDNLARIYKFKIDTPWKKLPEAGKEAFLYGINQKWTKMIFTHPEKKTSWVEYVHWNGVIAEAKTRLAQAKSELYRKNMSELMTETICPACHGARIKSYPAATQLGGKTIHQLCEMTLGELAPFFTTLPLTDLEKIVAEELLKEIRERISFLVQVGVHYLQLERTAPSLSGGESQRVRLASQIGTGLVGAIYVLDEPSIGLHPADHHKLIGTLKALRDQGNTVLVVEHDRDTMLAADEMVDVGPGAGSHGGRILVQGSASDVMQCKESITGDYLAGRRSIAVKAIRKLQNGLEIRGASYHNLKNVTVKIPLGGLICITGVSGSGKSSLISDILVPALANKLHKAKLPVGKHESIVGLEHLDKSIAVDQTPIGRTPRSNAATYIKLFDDIRDLFAELPESKLRGFTPAHFSFNVKTGSCHYCGGLGKVRVDMDFMEDAELECPQCKGERFDPEILAVEFKGHHISDVLNLDVEHALPLFEALPHIRGKLEVLSHVGLDYLRLGQPSTTLSGGEAQRIKLAKELVRPSTGRTLYILDEPTTGLHFHDVARLSSVLQRLIDKGNTVLIIEHNMDLVKTADWVIELGPKAGSEGGQIIAEGTPEAMAKKKTPTGLALKEEKELSVPKPSKTVFETSFLRVENAQQNNLKGFTLSIPRGKITVFTGPSGSGKSSLAFETIYAEGQRRYTETLPSYARQTIKQLPKPKVDRIVGLSPSIALEQKTGGLNPRSTIGTMTEIYDSLRVLYAHLGTPYCPETGEEIRHISKEYVVNQLLQKHPGAKIHLLSPTQLQKKETFEELCIRLQRSGFLRIRLNGVYYELDQPIPFETFRKNELFLVVDRMVIDPKNEKRLFEAVEKATSLSNGSVMVDVQNALLFYNLAFAVEKTGKSYPPITPQTFSFNAEAGMCPECQGLGMTYGARLEDHPDFRKMTILDFCDRLFKEKGTAESYALIESLFRKMGIDVNTKKLSLEDKSIFLNGGTEYPLKKGLTVRWLGIQPALANIARMAKKQFREMLLPILTTSTCPACQGARLNPLARAVRLQTRTIGELCRLPLNEAKDFLAKLKVPPFIQETQTQICKSLDFLLSIGVSYLSLDRSAPTLSGGEIQRIRLARQLGSGLTSCLYVLDEPTIGLHPYNNALLNQALKKLRDLGNTLILVEHDPLTIQEADFLVDFGPKAGKEGGFVTASGTIQEIVQNPQSLTGDYLSGRKSIPIPKKRRLLRFDIVIEKVTLHNLNNLSIKLPRSAITCLTGVSGSGKSTLMRHLLKPAAEKAIAQRVDALEYLGTSFEGLAFDKVICIDQSPIGQTVRADVSTYTDIQPLIRSHFASLPGAKVKGLQPKHFSPNHRRGMCPTCWGLGYKTVDLQYLPSVRIPCTACHGFRLNPVSLEVRYKGKNLGQILEMSIESALQWFSEIPKVVKRLQTLCSVGLSYLKLGQEIASLSGGEAQRLRLSRELAKRETGSTLYLIDEPTVGLHSEDIAKLLPIFHRLADKKNTLIIIEHNLDVIANADYIIDLGPDAGIHGGKIMAQGTPEEVSRVKNSRTAPFLKERLRMPNLG